MDREVIQNNNIYEVHIYTDIGLIEACNYGAGTSGSPIWANGSTAIVNMILENDIDMAQQLNFEGFQGLISNFEGNNYTISNIAFTDYTYTAWSFFGGIDVGGVAQNFKLKDIYIQAADIYTLYGRITTAGNNVLFKNISITGMLYASTYIGTFGYFSYVGGKATIYNCSFSGNMIAGNTIEFIRLGGTSAYSHYIYNSFIIGSFSAPTIVFFAGRQTNTRYSTNFNSFIFAKLDWSIVSNLYYAGTQATTSMYNYLYITNQDEIPSGTSITINNNCYTASSPENYIVIDDNSNLTATNVNALISKANMQNVQYLRAKGWAI